ncbi:MAG TPA: SbcC/MukB-like Walker B domain-containing protein, partial [Myxococcota bacterium]|nr:SbcC/MukB-like Walker B domain-containing protein [Myxococcota bacterium]
AVREQLGERERALKDADRRRRELAAREPEWRQLDACARRLGEHAGAPLEGRAGLERARRAIAAELGERHDREAELRELGERRTREARELLAAGGPFEPELLRLKDRLGAELLAASFEDASVEEAAAIEARLGPLAQALVVDDPRDAARLAGARADALPDVWLVSPGPALEALVAVPTGGSPGAGDAVVEERFALRVSRIPARPRLGRRAREQRAAELRAEAAAAAGELDQVREVRRRLERLVADGEELLAGQAVWLGGDPGPALAELHRAIGELELEVHRLREEASAHAEAARALRPRIDGLRALLVDAHLLDPPDHALRATALDAEHGAALAAQAEVARTARAAALVEGDLGTLRTAPLSDAELVELRHRVEALRRDRDRLEAAAEALEHVRDNVEALAWSDAPARLADNQALVPALEAQLRGAEDARDAAERASLDAERGHEDMTARWQDADGRQRAVAQQLAAAEARLAAGGIPDPTADAVREAEAAAARLAEELRTLDVRAGELKFEEGQREMTLTQATDRRREAEDKVASERREAEPATALWTRLRAQALQHGLLGGALGPAGGEASGIRGHVNLLVEARTKREVLVERLRTAQGGPALLAEIEILRDTSDATFADAYLHLWLAVREWLRRRLPAQVAEVDDPREALLRLRDQLSSLEERLARQEQDLRGASEDVARGIDVQIRKARGQVNRLTKNLEGVSFGGIRDIRVLLRPDDRMEQVLRALREGHAQGLLFQGDLPIEEALAEIFRRHGGGRTGGQRLLDYREYVHLQVEIRRKGSSDWEIANPTRLSTGEAIGVGAALMMVVLTEWERDATLLRGKKSHGSLRFLFLDEANRLSHDNLGVLFDLCQTLDLQLLIAAPEVARAEGNTTYRLVRRSAADGRDEVVVSGRRTRAEA